MRLFAGLLASVAAAALSAGAAWAQGASQGPVKVGVLTDMSGLYSDIGGAGSVTMTC